jgi:hypothetical protein
LQKLTLLTVLTKFRTNNLKGLGATLTLLVGVMYFHDKGANRRVVLIGLMFCAAFVLISFFARPQPENDRVLV